MVRVPYYGDFVALKKGSWSPEEDEKLKAYIKRYGIWNWTEMPKAAGLLRSGKSCRLRWVNYLKPGIKRGNYSRKEEEIIIKMHGLMGNRWSAIAARLPGRTDNEIKNYWHTKLRKRLGSTPAPRAKSSIGDTPIESPKAGSSIGSEHQCSSQTSMDDSFSSASSLVDGIQMEGNFENPMSLQSYTCDSSSSVTSPDVGTVENQMMEPGGTFEDFEAFPMDDLLLLGDYFWGTYADSELACSGCKEWVQEPLWG